MILSPHHFQKPSKKNIPRLMKNKIPKHQNIDLKKNKMTLWKRHNILIFRKEKIMKKEELKRVGFILGSTETHEGEKEKHIKMHTTEDVDYVTFYKNDRLIPIPYDCLVCFIAGHIDNPKPVPPNIASLEKLIIDIQDME